MCFQWKASPKKKLPINRVNEALNEEVQTDFRTAKIADENFEVFNKVELGTG